MFRAELRLCTGTHDETLPQLALAIQQLNCHARLIQMLHQTYKIPQ